MDEWFIHPYSILTQVAGVLEPSQTVFGQDVGSNQKWPSGNHYNCHDVCFCCLHLYLVLSHFESCPARYMFCFFRFRVVLVNSCLLNGSFQPLVCFVQVLIGVSSVCLYCIYIFTSLVSSFFFLSVS